MSETIVTLICSKCNQIKPSSDFYKKRSHKSGHQGYCKICHGIHSRNWLRSPKGTKYKNRYKASKKGKEILNQCHKKYIKSEKGKAMMMRVREKYPNRVKARVAVNHAIRDGMLPSTLFLLCSKCKKPAQQYHHHKGYAPEHWLDVIPICKKCHNSEHIHKSL